MSESGSTWPCPYCGERIKRRAIRCRFCGESLVDEDEDEDDEDWPRRGGDASADEGLQWLVPIGRSGWAIAAGYCGLLSCFPVVGLLFGILGVVTGMLALRQCKANPRLGGRGRAVFGIVAGALAGLFNLVLVIMLGYGLATGNLK